MSPLALFYLLLASPVLNTNWHHESPLSTPSSWNTFDVESLLRHYTPSSVYESSPITRRSNILRELINPTEEFSTFSPFESLYSAKPTTSMVAKILIEKLLRRSSVESSIVRPEEVLLLAKLFRSSESSFESVLPKVKLAKLLRRLVKKINKVARYETLPFGKNVEFCNMCENICESSTPYTSTWGMCSICHKVCPTSWTPVSPISPFSPSYLNKERVVRKVVKALLNKVARYETLPFAGKNVEFCNMCESICMSSTPYTSNTGMCSICSEVCPNTWTPVSPVSPFSPSFLNKEREVKIVRKLVKAIVLTKKHSTKKHFCKVAERVCESSTENIFSSPKINKICKVAEIICENIVNPYSYEPVFGGKLLKKLVKSSLRMESSPVFGRRFF